MRSQKSCVYDHVQIAGAFMSVLSLRMRTGDILIAMRQAIQNWPAFQNASGLQGWTEEVPMCEWGGIVCNAQNRATEL